MATTLRANFTYVPQIAESHISAYFRQELIISKLAWRPKNNRFPATPGDTITFPYFSKLGEAQDGVEDTDVEIDDLGDASFTAQAKESVKGVGITDTALKAMGCTHAEWEAQAHKQVARVLAEKMEKDVWTELHKAASHDTLPSQVADLTIATAFGTDKGAQNTAYQNQLCNIRALSEGLTDAFGDKRYEAAAIILHSQHYKDLEIDTTAGFLKADANDPLFKIKGFVGRSAMFWGLPFFVNDNVQDAGDITITDSNNTTQDYKTYNAVFLKKDAFGVMIKQMPKIEYDRNILKRRDFMVATQWYAVRGFHKVISTEDVRVGYKRFATKKQA